MEAKLKTLVKAINDAMEAFRLSTTDGQILDLEIKKTVTTCKVSRIRVKVDKLTVAADAEAWP
ncbi:hypothetical protein [Brevifollis gellanilyticus]|uniref:Uncharacterized protein n=1 Tax=Brevifollis gellanilyticus TaxID=748831 RepID=A0A512MBP6_9BACT|nr:hypothetical protein [Brevifollis gellanilyticus]GEP44146.1 hypothetical protein BGE01nite_34370 [Brevifollis gellanilyticus]